MAFHVQQTYGLTAPSGACVSEARKSRRVGRAIVRCGTAGTVKHARLKKVHESDITMSGKGDPAFASVTAGVFVEGTPKIVSAEGTEMNDGEYNDFEIAAKLYENAS